MKIDAFWIGIGALALIGGMIAFTGSGTDTTVDGPEPENPVVKADRIRACQQLTGEVEDRVAACLAQIGTMPMSRMASDEIKSWTGRGKVFMLGGDIAIDGVEPMTFTMDGDYKDLALGTDEAAFAAKLREDGVRGIVVGRDLTGAVDRNKTVISRLAQHDFVEWFQLRHVTEEAFLYTVRSTPAKVPTSTGDRLLKGLRARLAGTAVPKQTWTPEQVRLIASARLQGGTLMSRYEVSSDLEKGLDDLASKLRREWERNVEIYGHGTLEERLDDLRFDIQVVMEVAYVEPRSRYAIFDLWEMGVDGVMFSQRDPKPGEKLEEKFTVMPGSEHILRSKKSADHFLREAVAEGGWNDRRPWEKDTRTKLQMIRTQHFMESKRGGGDAVRLFRAVPEEPMENVTDDSLRQMLIDGGDWWADTMEPDGYTLYKYWPTQNRSSTDYNEVRHILATRDLSDTWRYNPDPRYLEHARMNMDWLLRYEVTSDDPKHATLPHPPDGTMLFRYPFTDMEVRGKQANQKLGTVAVALLGWVEWAKATGSKAEDERIKQMARFVQSMRDEEGRFHAYFVPPNHSYARQKNDIVPGEAALALGMVAEYFDDPKWLEGHEKFLDFYEPWFRSREVRKRPEGRWPHATYTNTDRLDLVQFGPWSVMANKQYYKLTGNERAAKFGLEVADWMIDNYQWTGDRSPWPDYVGGYYKLPNELPAMQTFCYSEGTAAAYSIAAQYKPEVKEKYDMSTREALRFMRVMQYDELDSYFAAHPELIHGGIKYQLAENKVRIDYVGHGLSTVSQYLDARVDDPAVEVVFSARSPNDRKPKVDAKWVPWDVVEAQRAAAAKEEHADEHVEELVKPVAPKRRGPTPDQDGDGSEGDEGDE
ncbi:MAG: hypothetical protein EP330_20575 [Deltaproteobacteria bacterium]|nr:MAG: hypothetical protein EP330_20575 [Deltaproteobacteria bacterium]